MEEEDQLIGQSLLSKLFKKKRLKKSVPIQTQLKYIDDSFKKILKASNLVKSRKKITNLKAVPELFIKFNVLQRMKRDLMLNYVSSSIWKHIPIDYFVEERKNLYKMKVPERFIPTKDDTTSDLVTMKPIKSQITRPVINETLFEKWSNEEIELDYEDYKAFESLLNSEDVEIPDYIKSSIGNRIYEMQLVKTINSNLITKTTESILRNDLLGVYTRELIKLFVENQTINGITAPYFKDEKEIKLTKKFTKAENIIVKKIQKEIEDAIIDELKAREQYISDSIAYKGDREIKYELMKHSKEENAHFKLLTELLKYIEGVSGKLWKMKVPDFLPSSGTDQGILKHALDDEKKAVVDYQVILNKIGTKNKDTAVYEVIKEIQKQEREHVKDVETFMKINEGTMTSEDLLRGKFLLPHTKKGFSLLNKFNKFISLYCDFTESPGYLFKSSQRVVIHKKSTIPVCTYSIVDGEIEGIDFLKNMETIIKKSEAIMFIPLVGDIESKFAVRPLILTYKKLNKLIVQKKRFKKIVLITVKHTCKKESFFVTYALDPLEYTHKPEIKIQTINNFFINCFRNKFDWTIQKAIGPAIHVLNDTINKTKENHVTYFNVLKVAYSIVLKRVLYETLDEDELVLNNVNTITNRVVYCASLLTLLQSHFNKPFLDYKIVDKFLQMVKAILIKHLLLKIPVTFQKRGFEKKKKKKPKKLEAKDFYKKFLFVRRIVNGPANFLKNFPITGKAQKELAYIFKALEDPFVSTLFSADCYIKKNSNVRNFNKNKKWKWDQIQLFIKNKGFLKTASGHITKSLTQDVFDDNRIKLEDRPLKIAMNKIGELDPVEKCQVINECSFQVVKITNGNVDVSKNVELAKEEALKRNEKLLEIDKSFRLFSERSIEKLFKELFIK